MAGYDGNSMSINAREAYAAGERPWSRWRKQDIIAVIKAAVEAGNLELHCSFRSLCKIALEDLKRVCLYRSSWHHTSFVFNLTEFYSVNLDAVENLTEELIEDLIREGQARRKAERAKKAEDKGELWRCEYLKWYGGGGIGTRRPWK